MAHSAFRENIVGSLGARVIWSDAGEGGPASCSSLGFSVQELGFSVQELGFSVQELGFSVQELGFSVQELGV